MIYSYSYKTIIGDVTLVVEDSKLIKIIFGNKTVGKHKETALIKDVKKQLDEYFEGSRKEFNIPIKLYGTKFQQQVWHELTKIPYGKCISYQELAAIVKSKNYARAVGTANGKNPIPIIIPCHRVISKDKSIGGYIGGIDIKQKLIEIEK